MTDRIAVVTGGTRGIGEAISLRLKDWGRTVVASYGGNDEAAKAFTERTGIEARKWNVGDHEECVEACAAIEKDIGAIDIMVNNAGITRDNLAMRMKDDEWTDVVDTNLSAIFRLSKACIKGMMKARWGRIIGITSIVGVTGNPGQANYAASKAGMIGFSKSSIINQSREHSPSHRN